MATQTVRGPIVNHKGPKKQPTACVVNVMCVYVYVSAVAASIGDPETQH